MGIRASRRRGERVDKVRLDEIGPENLELLREHLGQILEISSQEWLWRTAMMELNARMEIRYLLDEVWPEYRLDVALYES
jgi:hypothetical protein